MAGLNAYMSNQLNHAGQWANGMKNHAGQWAIGMKNHVQHGVTAKIHAAQDFVEPKYLSVRQKCIDSAEKTKDFILTHKKELFFIGCGIITAYFAPQLFFPAAVITLILRVQGARQLEKLADHYMKDDRNPYKTNPQYGPHYVSTLALTMGTIAAVDSLALGTFFAPASLSVALLPIVGGVAVGSTVAKLGMDIAHRLF